jgi:hypothetical protein
LRGTAVTNGNPPREVDAIGDRVIAAFARLQTTLRAILDLLSRLSESSGKSAERRENEYKEVRDKIVDVKQLLVVLTNQLENLGKDVDDVKEHTNPRIVLPRFENERNGKVTNTSGPFAIHDGKIKFALPTSWVGWVLSLAVSAGVGGLILRGVQWLIGR